MIFYAGKIAMYLMAPLAIALVLLLAAVVLWRRRWLGRAVLLAGIAVLWVFSTRIVSESLIHGLETEVQGSTLENAPQEKAIVVLGGDLHPPTATHKQIELVDASDRLLHAVRLYRAGKAPLIILTGGNVSFLGGSAAMNEAQAAELMLQEWGIPKSAILTETKSQNTHENATETRKILDRLGIRRVLLVTSAYHMPRAVAVFHKAGVDVVPCPTDYMTGWGEPDPLFRFLPDAGALADCAAAVKERVGLVLYRLRGWA